MQKLVKRMVIVATTMMLDPPVRLVGECFPEWWACRRKVGANTPSEKGRGPRGHGHGRGGMLRWRGGNYARGVERGQRKRLQMGGTHTPR